MVYVDYYSFSHSLFLDFSLDEMQEPSIVNSETLTAKSDIFVTDEISYDAMTETNNFFIINDKINFNNSSYDLDNNNPTANYESIFERTTKQNTLVCLFYHIN